MGQGGAPVVPLTRPSADRPALPAERQRLATTNLCLPKETAVAWGGGAVNPNGC